VIDVTSDPAREKKENIPHSHVDRITKDQQCGENKKEKEKVRNNKSIRSADTW
jgi:hypothetical protein